MKITVERSGHASDVAIAGLSPDSTLADLMSIVAPDGGHATVDGVDHPPETSVADVVRDGSLLVVDGPRPSNPAGVVAHLHAVSGPAGGQVWRLGPGAYSVGEGRPIGLIGVEGHVGVSSAGAITWNGSAFPPGHLRVGEHRLRAGKPNTDATAHPPGTRSLFNRPPRHIEGRDPSPIPVPARQTVAGKPRRISPLMLVLPVITGVGMALIFGRMMFLAFALLGPITMIGSTVDDRRRRRREHREADEQFAVDAAALANALELRAGQETLRLIEAQPAVGEILVAALDRSRRLWERRRGHDDFLTVALGHGPAPWVPSLAAPITGEPELTDVVERASRLSEAPVITALSAGRVLGISGGGAAARGLASDVVCQLAAAQGPADLRVAVITDSPHAWEWVKWLPHSSSSQISDIRLLAPTDPEIEAVLATLRLGNSDALGPTTLLVVDHGDLDDDQQRLVRECLSGLGRPCSGVVLVDRPEDLPTACTEVVDLVAGRFARPHAGLVIEPLDPRATSPHVATAVARALAPLDDPESVVAGLGLPDRVEVSDLLDLDGPTPEMIARRWKSAGLRPHLTAPIGMSEAGPFTIDLVNDGPHGLMAGTTGSGKSELLRTLVVGLAANLSPDHLTFVLVDYKGGAAFDACADLPHVVGLVTDLDEHLGQRALESLEAELHHREKRLRSAAANDIDALWAQAGVEPLPRLVVVIDEFATLASELPTFMDAIVDIAQRGRSLGVHMLLATQRPSGVIKDSIRANTNLRISLRVQTTADSKDVLNAPDAAALPRAKPGRGYARLGPGELICFQTALSTSTRKHDGPTIEMLPFTFSVSQPPLTVAAKSKGPTALDSLVRAIGGAHQLSGRPEPRRPWAPPLDEQLAWSSLPVSEGAACATIGLADQPRRQRHAPWTWAPHDDGNLLVVGPGGSGPSEALMGTALSLARRSDPDQVQIYAIDHGGGGLAALEALPHVGAVVNREDIERQQRLLRLLRDEISARRSGSTPITTVLLVDGIGGFRAAFDEPELAPYRDMLAEIATNGPSQGVFMAIGADQQRALGSALAGALPTRLVFGLADRLEYGMLGVKAPPLDMPRRMAIDPRTQEQVQVGRVSAADVAAVAADASLTTRTPAQILSLPRVVALAEVVDAGSITAELARLPVGLDDTTLTAAIVELHVGDHLLIGGPPRSGRTTTLCALAEAVRKLAPDQRLAAVCPRPSTLRLSPHLDEITRDATELDLDSFDWLLVDDAEEVDGSEDLADHITRRAPGATIIAAGRTDALRGSHRHWTRTMRAARRGLILKPFDAGDGDLLDIRIPRRRPVDIPGRGYLVDGGVASLVQVMST